MIQLQSATSDYCNEADQCRKRTDRYEAVKRGSYELGYTTVLSKSKAAFSRMLRFRPKVLL